MPAATKNQQGKRLGMYIDSEWLAISSLGSFSEVINPATRETIAQVPDGSFIDV